MQGMGPETYLALSATANTLRGSFLSPPLTTSTFGSSTATACVTGCPVSSTWFPGAAVRVVIWLCQGAGVPGILISVQIDRSSAGLSTTGTAVTKASRKSVLVLASRCPAEGLIFMLAWSGQLNLYPPRHVSTGHAVVLRWSEHYRARACSWALLSASAYMSPGVSLPMVAQSSQPGLEIQLSMRHVQSASTSMAGRALTCAEAQDDS